MQKLTGVIPGEVNIPWGHPGDAKTHQDLAADNLSLVMQDEKKSTFYDGGWREIVFVTRLFVSKIEVDRYWS